MSTIKELGRRAWRKYQLDGVASSGFQMPEHADIFSFVDKVDQQVAALAAAGTLQGEWDASSGTFPGSGAAAKGSVWLVTTAGTTGGTFFADGDRIVALVANASTSVFSGNWGIIPANARTVVTGIDSGAGTANAIQVTTEDAVGDGTIVAFSLFEDTTSSPVTISINGATVLTLKTNRGVNASALTAGMEIWGRVRSSDSTFRLLNDQDVSALVAQAEAAKTGAEAAASVLVDRKYNSLADAQAATIGAAGKQIRIGDIGPTYTDAETMPGADVIYRRMTAAEVDAGAFPTPTIFRSVDRYLPNGDVDAARGGYWVYGEHVVNAIQIGCDPYGGNDCKATLEYFWNLKVAQMGGGAIIFPPGKYLFSSRPVFELPATETDLDAIIIRGFGGASRLIFDTADQAGGIKTVRKHRYQKAEAYDLELIDTHGTGDTISQPTETGGCALDMDSTWGPTAGGATGWGTSHRRNVIIERVNAIGLQFSGFRWSKGFRVANAFYPIINECAVKTSHWSGPYTDQEGLSYETPFGSDAGAYGIEMEQCYMPWVNKTRINGRFDQGLYIWGDRQPDFEDFRITNNVIEGDPRVGLHVDHTNANYNGTIAGEPGGIVSQNFFNGHQYDAVFEHITHPSIVNNVFHTGNSSVTANWQNYDDDTCIRMLDVRQGTIVGNVFGNNGFFTDVDHCTRSVSFSALCSDIICGGNTHRHLGIGYDISAGAAQSITCFKDQWGTRQVDDNWHYPTYYHYERSGAKQCIHAPPLNWTPTVTINASTTGITYTTRSATITRKGESAEIQVNITLSSKGGLTGTLLITGCPLLPFIASPLAIGVVSGDTGLSADRGMRAIYQADGNISIRTTNDASAPYADASLGGAQVTDTFSISLSGEFMLVNARNANRLG